MKNEKPKLILPDSCRKRAEELQAESMSDDGKVGIIQEYLSDKQRTCAIEIWREALQETGRPAKWQASEINNIVLGFPEWKRMQYPLSLERMVVSEVFKNVVYNHRMKTIQSRNVAKVL